MSQNPYAPPASKVADVESGVPIERPKPVKTALTLCWISLALDIPLVAEELFKGPDPADGEVSPAFFTFVVLFSIAWFAFAIWVIISIGRARNWARIVYAVLTGLGLISIIASFGEILARPWYSGPVELLVAVMDVAVVVLLYLPASNAWFRVRGLRPADGSA
jgi:hypothetical protein